MFLLILGYLRTYLLPHSYSQPHTTQSTHRPSSNIVHTPYQHSTGDC